MLDYGRLLDRVMTSSKGCEVYCLGDVEAAAVAGLARSWGFVTEVIVCAGERRKVLVTRELQ